MGLIGNRYLQGQPVLPYANVTAYQNTDAFLDLAFLDHTGAAVVPTAINIEIDDLTNSVALLGPTALAAGGSASGNLLYPAFAATMYLQIAAPIWTMTYPYQGSQVCQIGVTFSAVDSVTGASFTSTSVLAIVNLVAVGTVSGVTP